MRAVGEAELPGAPGPSADNSLEPLPERPPPSLMTGIALNAGAGLFVGTALLFPRGAVGLPIAVAACFAAVVARLALGPRVRPIAFAAGLVAPLAGCLTYLFVIPDVAEWLQRRTFEPSAWQSNADGRSRSPIRIRMIDDLMKRHDPRGWPRARIVALLGPGDDSPWRAPDRLVYWLGPERGFLGIDSEWLSIGFDAQDRVIEWRIVRD